MKIEISVLQHILVAIILLSVVLIVLYTIHYVRVMRDEQRHSIEFKKPQAIVERLLDNRPIEHCHVQKMYFE